MCQDWLVVLESNLTRHHVVDVLLLMMLLLVSLLQIGFFKALLRHRLVSIEMVWEILVTKIRRLCCRNDMICDLLGTLGQVQTRLVPLGLLSQIGLGVISITVEGIFGQLRMLS